ncbi:MAG: hypothetical protein NT076_01155 [Candidatus Pacearchaeota archaeon]|nr:hypothetical protein [Candidatus Pacearchaeota archaeon]
MKQNKRGLSEIVGYVLLIVIAISLSLLVYTWLKNQVPKEEKACPENLALSIQSYNCLGNHLQVIIKNNGLFDINGFLARYAVKEDGLAGKDLMGITPVSATGRIFKLINSSEVFVEEFAYPDDKTIAEIEITPIKLVEGKMTICSNSAVRQKIDC